MSLQVSWLISLLLAAVQAHAELRSRWETGHVVAFTAWFIGVALLLHGVLRAVSPSLVRTADRER